MMTYLVKRINQLSLICAIGFALIAITLITLLVFADIQSVSPLIILLMTYAVTLSASTCFAAYTHTKLELKGEDTHA